RAAYARGGPHPRYGGKRSQRPNQRTNGKGRKGFEQGARATNQESQQLGDGHLQDRNETQGGGQSDGSGSEGGARQDSVKVPGQPPPDQRREGSSQGSHDQGCKRSSRQEIGKVGHPW